MNDDLRAHLRFFRDLGVRELYLDSPAEPSGGRPASAADPREKSPKSSPEPSPDPAPELQPEYSDAVSAPQPAPEARKADSAEQLRLIRENIGDCTRCKLHEGRTQIVFGDGNPEAKLVFVGEGPGADEDAQGIPFVGRAGQLLTKMIEGTAEGEGIPLKRRDVYICNVVKCRPPGNRTPERDEMETCGQFLARQLDAIQPKAICVLGSTAAKALLDTTKGITKLRGEWRKWKDIPVMPTFHPSYLLRAYNKEAKRQAWEDLKKVLHYVYE